MTPTVILTRPVAQSESFGAAISKLWTGPLHVIISPLIQIVPVAVTWPKLDAVIFTSVHGVQAAQDVGLPKGVTAWCVGPATAQMAKAAGFTVATGPGDADGLVAQLLDSPPQGRIAHIRGRHARGDVSERLAHAGIDCADVVAYDQRTGALSNEARVALNGDKTIVIPLFSPRSCTIFQAQRPFTAPLHVVVISDAVQAALDQDHGWQVRVADKPDGAAMLDATLATLETLVR